MSIVGEIPFDPAGGDVFIDVFFGQAQFGQYSLNHHDSTGHNTNNFANGNNIDNLPDRVPVPVPTKDLTNTVLSWTMTIAALPSGKNERYYARITPIQDGAVLENASFEYSGDLNGSEIIAGLARFIA